ncbi:MAG: ABC transporter permease, partial [Oscillospiraceae bacterium]|nr:ABC transporter permease [Oscillospiraceae bacterium]
MGRGAIVIGLAAVIIGEVLGSVIFGKHFNFVAKLAFAAVGAIIYFLVLQLVMLLGLSSANNKLFSAIVVIIFLAVPYLRNSAKTSFKKAAKNAAMEAMEGDAGNA